MDNYLLGDILVSWDGGGYALNPGQYLERFRHSGSWQGERLTLRGHMESLSPYTACPQLAQSKLYRLYQVNDERLLVYPWAYLRDAYGIWIDRLGRAEEEVCIFDPALLRQPPMEADWFFGVSGLHRALLLRDRPVLHASYVFWQDKAVLFTAPSQTGKTTQASLWQQHAGARIVNGDRVLLGKRNGVWFAHGYPHCGSSDICLNQSAPICAVVVLEQGRENRVVPMTAGEKIRSLTAGFALYHWLEQDIEKALSLATSIAQNTNVVRLICRPDADAVRVLREYLEENDHANSK